MKNSQKTQKNANQSANTQNAEIAKKDNANLSEINLKQFADKLANVELKVKNVKETLYIYPEGWTKEKINSDEGKHFRNKLRSKLKSFCNNIFYYAKTDNVESLKKEIETFKTFYRTNYRMNDLSIRSLTNSEKREKDIEIMLSIVKECEGK